MKKIPSIKSVMTAFPHWIEIGDKVKKAVSLMSEHSISHLAVKEEGKLIGVISLHDIRKIADLDVETKTVRDICVLNPYVVTLDEPLDNVLIHMANHHIGSVLILKNDRLAGVFTMHDACRCFAKDLRYQFHPQTGNDIA